MINLITGVPGSGKTVYSLDFMIKMLCGGRPLYVHGIPNLKIPHTPVVCGSLTCEVCPPPPVEPFPPDELDHDADEYQQKQYEIDSRNFKNHYLKYQKELDKFNLHLKADEWHKWAPDGALIFYDEVQNVYRPRSNAAKVPPSVSAFETHRHKGLDFYLVSQSPLLFDANVRRLVGRHIHLRPTWAGRYQFEWPECNNTTTSVSGAIKSKYRLNKKVFDLFKSSSMHTKQTKKVPFALYVIAASIVLLITLGVRINTRAEELVKPEQQQISSTGQIQNLSIEPIPEQLNRSVVVSWANRGIPKNQFQLIPTSCEIRKRAVRCPPYSLDNEYLKSLTIDRLCTASGNGCFLYFKIRKQEEKQYQSQRIKSDDVQVSF